MFMGWADRRIIFKRTSACKNAWRPQLYLAGAATWRHISLDILAHVELIVSRFYSRSRTGPRRRPVSDGARAAREPACAIGAEFVHAAGLIFLVVGQRQRIAPAAVDAL